MKLFFVLALFAFALSLQAKTCLVVEPFIPDDSLVRAAEACAGEAGYSVTTADIGSLAEKGCASYDLTVFCDGAWLPQEFTTPFWHYLNNGKKAVFLGAPAWEHPLVKVNGKWTERDKYMKKAAFKKPAFPLFDFCNGAAKTWYRKSQETNAVMGWKTAHDPETGFYYFDFTAEFPGGYDYVSLDVPGEAFPEGSSVTMFTAKGDGRTPSIAVGWAEEDGSRWTCKAVLEEEWALHYIEADAFKYAGGNDERKDTAFDPRKAKTFFAGFDGSSNNTYPEHRFSLGGLGTCLSDENTKALAPISNVGMDYMSLAPDNAFFEMHGVASFGAEGVSSVPGMPREMKSSHMRPSAAGYGKKRDWRWLSWSRCETAEGAWRGNPVAGLVRFDNAQKNSQYAAFAISDRDWYKKPENQRYITDIIRRMDTGVYIRSAGSDRFTYLDGQPVTVGIDLANVAGEERDIDYRITVKNNATGKTVFEKKASRILAPGGRFDLSQPLSVKEWPREGYNVNVNVSAGGKLIDNVNHDFYIWRPRTGEPFVEIRNGRFYKGGRELKFHGVNYHPTCATSSWNWGLFLEWFGEDFYDPEVIERDLSNMNSLGFNAVSVQIFNTYPDKPKYHNVTDFLRRCENHGIYVDLALVSNPKEKDFRERFEFWAPIIKELRLPESRALFAYDIDWEPTWLDPGYRKQFDGDWEQWIAERYGSVEAAEKIWGCSVTRDAGGAIENPSVPVVHRDSPKRGEALAYRRFLEFEAYKKYSRARDCYKEADPNHFVSFRMHAAGDVCDWYGLLPYSFYYLGKAVDFFAPEAYAMGTGWENHMHTGRFTRAVAHMSNPDLPMVYKEVGYKTIEGEKPFVSERGLERQAQYFRDFYRMLTEGGVNGVFWWFYPGGYRVLEGSDYGVINPDDSDKPVTKVIREMGPAFLASPSFEPGVFLTVDTSHHVDFTDATMLYNQVETRWRRLADAGKKPGLRAEAFGRDTKTADYVSVTNDPWQKGMQNPPKYVDGAIDRVRSGKRSLEEGDTVEAGETLFVTVTNINEATWLDGNGEGSVVLMANDTPYELNKPLKTGERAEIKITVPEGDALQLRFYAVDRGFFGEVFELKVK
ncbi:MAG: beta-galactosidase [Abditibacteriota bacterium]|nr:beta-galactosidase [Abditibacteriota bacterium]